MGLSEWPEDRDDRLARAEWGFHPKHDLARAFSEYLLSNVRERYAKG